jgi:oxygen-dependent protoporphyrinogen oxidase
MPAGTLMGIPVDRAAVAGLRGLLTEAEVRRAEAEPTIPAPALAEDVAVGAWLEQRLGRAVVDRLAEPLLGGVYAGHADQLSLQATIPPLWERARAGGSLLHGEPVAPPLPGPVFAGIRGGMGRLPEALLQRLTELGVAVRTRTTVRGLRRERAGWRLELGPAPAPDYLDVDAVVVAVQAPAAARLVQEAGPEAAAELAVIRTASVAVISTLIPAEQLAGLDASGLLVPPVEGRLVKAATFSSLKWPWLAEQLAAGPRAGLHAVRLSVGRLGEEASLQRDDADLIAAAVRDLDELLEPVLGAGHPPIRPVSASVTRWGGSLPQFVPGHLDRIARVRAALPAGVTVAGAAIDGVGIPACIASAGRAVADLLATRDQTEGRIRA